VNSESKAAERKMTNKTIYTSLLKPYKLDKLNFGRSGFAALYRWENELFSLLQCEYKLCTHMWLLRFNEEDILIVMGMWYKHHSIKGNYARLKNQIIPETYLFTREIIRERRHAEYQKRKAKREELGIQSSQRRSA
jgi:hypothetical protein